MNQIYVMNRKYQMKHHGIQISFTYVSENKPLPKFLFIADL